MGAAQWAPPSITYPSKIVSASAKRFYMNAFSLMFFKRFISAGRYSIRCKYAEPLNSFHLP